MEVCAISFSSIKEEANALPAATVIFWGNL